MSSLQTVRLQCICYTEQIADSSYLVNPSYTAIYNHQYHVRISSCNVLPFKLEILTKFQVRDA